MLYIGSHQNKVFVLHSPWGLHTKDPQTGQKGRDIIGRAVITPINLGQNFANVPRTWLDDAQAMVFIVPPEYLKQPKTR